MDYHIRRLTIDDAPACDAVIASLPYFFGDPDGIRDCARDVRIQAGFVVTVDDNVVAFITLLDHNDESTEVTWMAVHANHRRSGIGRRLIDGAAAAAASRGIRILCVLTLGPSVPEDPGDNYEGTRRFYRSMGFVPLRELQLSTWNDSHALILAKPLA